MPTRWLAFWLLSSAVHACAATDVRVDFTLDTADAYGAPLREQRYYYVYRPDNLPRTAPVPMVLVMEAGGGAPATFFHRKANQAGFVVVSCSFSGNSMGRPATVWNNDNPRITGFEDFDYTSEVIQRVKTAENANDVFITGLSKGGHMSLAYACERPSMLKAAASVDEFMGLTSNIPAAPLAVIVFQGTLDTNVPYTMARDTVDAWRTINGLMSVAPITTYESSPRLPGRVSRATWRGGINGTQVAFVTIIGGTHTYATPAIQTGYDYTDGVWAFFSQFLTSASAAPRIVSQPVDNVQTAGEPASYYVAATGEALGYQWQKNGEDISGATANWLTVTDSAPDDDGAAFRAVVRNQSGTVASNPAALRVKAPPAGPAVTTHPADQAVAAGQPVTFVVEAAGTPPLRYQWQKNGANIAGATEASLQIPAAITPDSGASFTAVVTDDSGSTTSRRATLTVTPGAGAPIILANPERARVLEGQAASFTVKAWSLSPLSYQWQKGTFTGNMADIPGATEATYTTPPAGLADHLTLFRCVVSNAAGNAASASEMLFVTSGVKPPTDITSAITAFAQPGTPFQYTITASGGTAPITFDAAPLPDGLSVDAVSGRIWGTPAAAGTFTITMEAANSAGTFSRVLLLTVTPDPPPVPIDTWRRATFGASAIDPAIAGDAADPDADGYSNLDEFNAGSNPLDPASAPAPQP